RGDGAGQLGAHDRLVGMIPSIPIQTAKVIVESPHRYHLVDAMVYVADVGCISTGTGGIQQPLPLYLRLGDQLSRSRCLYHPFFIADGPHEYGRMIPVAQDLMLEIRPVFCAAIEKPGLVEYEHAERITGIQQLRGRRIMTGAIGIHAHLLQQTDPVILKIIRQGAPYSGMVLVTAHAMDLHGRPIEKKPLVLVDGDGTDAKTDGLRVHDDAATAYEHNGAV